MSTHMNITILIYKCKLKKKIAAYHTSYKRIYNSKNLMKKYQLDYEDNQVSPPFCTIVII